MAERGCRAPHFRLPDGFGNFQDTQKTVWRYNMTASPNTQTKPVTGLSPANRREEREQAQAEALAEIAHQQRERQNKSRQLRQLRLSQQKKK
ncbi:MAG: hypothetical protein AAFX54_09130 [Pseudomonadota bacterium]